MSNPISRIINLMSLIIVLLVCAFLWLGVEFLFHSDSIKSKTPIKPEILPTTDGKTVDTIYVYKKK